MTPKRLKATAELVMARKRREFAVAARAALWGAQGEPKKTERRISALSED